LGGALTFASAVNVPGLAAAVPFYGLPGDLEWSKVTTPIQAHFAQHDDWATAAGAQKIKTAIEAAKRTTMELHVYDAHHAFMRHTDAKKYDEKSAKVAWERTLAFLRAHLS
jgi:carboxymethylenebutenolidase